MKRAVVTGLLLVVLSINLYSASPKVAYDMDMAQELCDGLPLETVEGIWLYPDDKVAVLILKNDLTGHQLPSYTISVVETSDSRLHPGESIGTLQATAQDNVFKIELSTEKKNEFLMKPVSCLATLTKEGDSFIIKKQKAPFKGRLNFNFNRLLPGFWKVVSIGITQSAGANTLQPPVGMIKIYPSYDGNGSSRRAVRYL